MDLSKLQEQMIEAMHASVVKEIKKGFVFKNNYDDRPDLSVLVNRLYGELDYEKIKEYMKENLEREIAKKVVDKLIAEMSTDIKQLMSHSTVREDLRFFLRSGMQKILDAVKEDKNG